MTKKGELGEQISVKLTAAQCGEKQFKLVPSCQNFRLFKIRLNPQNSQCTLSNFELKIRNNILSTRHFVLLNSLCAPIASIN